MMTEVLLEDRSDQSLVLIVFSCTAPGRTSVWQDGSGFNAHQPVQLKASPADLRCDDSSILELSDNFSSLCFICRFSDMCPCSGSTCVSVTWLLNQIMSPKSVCSRCRGLMTFPLPQLFPQQCAQCFAALCLVATIRADRSDLWLWLRETRLSVPVSCRLFALLCLLLLILSDRVLSARVELHLSATLSSFSSSIKLILILHLSSSLVPVTSCVCL